jgi:hypothetical protein
MQNPAVDHVPVLKHRNSALAPVGS